jgi:hypothetical protein
MVVTVVERRSCTWACTTHILGACDGGFEDGLACEVAGELEGGKEERGVEGVVAFGFYAADGCCEKV